MPGRHVKTYGRQALKNMSRADTSKHKPGVNSTHSTARHTQHRTTPHVCACGQVTLPCPAPYAVPSGKPPTGPAHCSLCMACFPHIDPFQYVVATFGGHISGYRTAKETNSSVGLALGWAWLQPRSGNLYRLPGSHVYMDISLKNFGFLRAQPRHHQHLGTASQVSRAGRTDPWPVSPFTACQRATFSDPHATLTEPGR